MPGNQPNRAIASGEAARIWKQYGLSSLGDLVLEDLALAMGVLVVEGPLDSADAWLLRKGERGLIRVKDSIAEPGRKRFAIAHELGHWVLHRRISQILACTNEDMLSAYKASAPELEASFFASALIMPEELFGKRIEGTTPTAQLLSRLSQEFQTSLTATALRYVDLREDYCAVVVSEKGTVKWWRESQDFKGRFWIDPGAKLSANTVAAGLFRGQLKPSKPEKVDLASWLPHATDFDSDVIIEESIPMTRYGQVLTMLWLP